MIKLHLERKFSFQHNLTIVKGLHSILNFQNNNVENTHGLKEKRWTCS